MFLDGQWSSSLYMYSRSGRKAKGLRAQRREQSELLLHPRSQGGQCARKPGTNLVILIEQSIERALSDTRRKQREGNSLCKNCCGNRLDRQGQVAHCRADTLGVLALHFHHTATDQVGKQVKRGFWPEW